MIAKTNYHMLKSLDFKAKHHGWLEEDEVNTLRKHFCIGERSDIDLQNLRDFVVLYFSGKTRDMEIHDLMSGIVGVIDNEKNNRGLEV